MQEESREQLWWKLAKTWGFHLYDEYVELRQDTVFSPLGPDRPDVYIWELRVKQVEKLVSEHPPIVVQRRHIIRHVIELLEQLIPYDDHREQHEKELARLRQQLDNVCAERDRPS